MKPGLHFAPLFRVDLGKPSMQETTDTQLIADAKNGDNRAFGQLVERYERMVHHLALRLVGNEDVASDLAQFESLLKVLGHGLRRIPVVTRNQARGVGDIQYPLTGRYMTWVFKAFRAGWKTQGHGHVRRANVEPINTRGFSDLLKIVYRFLGLDHYEDDDLFISVL